MYLRREMKQLLMDLDFDLFFFTVDVNSWSVFSWNVMYYV